MGIHEIGKELLNFPTWDLTHIFAKFPQIFLLVIILMALKASSMLPTDRWKLKIIQKKP